MNVEILSKKLIKPPISPVPNPESFKLSFFDQIPAPMYMILILYYPVNSNGLQDLKQRSNLLQKSLSETLTLFYPFAGRYIKEKLEIDCNNEGVEYLETEVNSSLSWILDGDNSIEVLKPLAFCPFESEKSPLVTVQFNTFECGGVAVGLAMSHRIADTFTMSVFMDAWAAASRGGIVTARQPNFPFASICPATDIEALSLVPPSVCENGGVALPKIVTKRFTFDNAAISKLKAEVIANTENSASNSSVKPRVTRVKAITAFLWKTLINVSTKASNNDRLRSSILGLTLNMRGRTNPPILVPENSCGNFVSMAAAKFKPNEETKDINLHSLVCQINDAITSKTKDIGEASRPDDFVSMASKFFRELGMELMSGAEIYIISSLCGFPLYQDFGWGMAAWTSIMPTPVDGNLLIRDNKDGDGIEVWVNLNETKMEVFQQDPDVVALTASSPSKTNSKK